MASDLSTYFGNKIARWIAGNAMPTEPADVFVALFDGNPKASGTEVTTTVDATGRKAVSWAALISGTGNVLESDVDVDFGLSDGACDIDYVGLFDASSSGNLLMSKILPAPIAVIIGTPVKLLAGDIVFEVGAAT